MNINCIPFLGNIHVKFIHDGSDNLPFSLPDRAVLANCEWALR